MQKDPNVSLESRRWNIWVILYLMKELRYTLAKLKPLGNGKFPQRISRVDKLLLQVC